MKICEDQRRDLFLVVFAMNPISTIKYEETIYYKYYYLYCWGDIRIEHSMSEFFFKIYNFRFIAY